VKEGPPKKRAFDKGKGWGGGKGAPLGVHLEKEGSLSNNAST